VVESIKAIVAILFFIVGHFDWRRGVWKTRQAREAPFGDVIAGKKKF
jgi:hypothetical protein